MIACQDPLGQLPPAAGTFAPAVDGLFYFLIVVSIFFFLLIAGLLTYSAFRWRRRTADQKPAALTTHNTMLEVVWTLIPTVILMVVFAWGWKGNLDQSVAPGDALQYQVRASQWKWAITHPGDSTPTFNEVYVPVDTPVKFIMSSADVIHSFYVPAMRAKRDVLPGRMQMVWFEATQTGDFPLFCAEYCGTDHSKMIGTVHVVSREEFADAPWRVKPTDPVELGKMRYVLCQSCHSTDGSVTATGGPSFKDLWGKQETLTDGTRQLVDADYVRESIRNPTAKIVQGFEGRVMTPFPDTILPEDEVDAIIEWLKTLAADTNK